VNLLLHQHLAAAELGSEVAGIGAMLPDLWRMADARMRLRAAAHAEGESEVVAALVLGVEHHLAVDRWFHASPVFLDGERALAASFAALGKRVPSASGAKLVLLSHVCWEMCLDGALVRRGSLAATMARVRAALRAAEPGLARAASLHGADARLGADRARFEVRLAEILAALAGDGWIAGYLDGEGIAWRLAAVRARLGLPSLPPEAHRAVGALLEAERARADEALEALLHEAPARLARSFHSPRGTG
jgi:hypothetical protein